MPHAAEFLSHLLPKQVFDQLRELAQSYERDEFIRGYRLKGMWFVVPMGILFFSINGTVVAASYKLLSTWLPDARWLDWMAFIVGLLILVGATIVELYWLFVWLARSALQSSPLSSSMEGLTSTRKGNEVLWISFCIVVSLGFLALAFPPIAAFLAILAMLAPVIYTLFD